MKRKTLVSAMLAGIVLFLSGCAATKEFFGGDAPEVTRQGNALYSVQCPVILDDGTIPTYVDENGAVKPVMSQVDIGSGRTIGGDLEVEMPGCISASINGGLTQGEERSSVLGDLGGLGITLIKALTGAGG